MIGPIAGIAWRIMDFIVRVDTIFNVLTFLKVTIFHQARGMDFLYLRERPSPCQRGALRGWRPAAQDGADGAIAF